MDESLAVDIVRKDTDRPRFDSRSRIAIALVKAWLDKSYRDIEVYFHNNKEILPQFNP